MHILIKNNDIVYMRGGSIDSLSLNINIIDCTNLEFIEYYDKFNITIDNKPLLRIKQDDLIKIKEEIQEIKELLKTIKNA